MGLIGRLRMETVIQQSHGDFAEGVNYSPCHIMDCVLISARNPGSLCPILDSLRAARLSSFCPLCPTANELRKSKVSRSVNGPAESSERYGDHPRTAKRFFRCLDLLSDFLQILPALVSNLPHATRTATLEKTFVHH